VGSLGSDHLDTLPAVAGADDVEPLELEVDAQELDADRIVVDDQHRHRGHPTIVPGAVRSPGIRRRRSARYARTVPALVAQGIEHRPPEPGAQVRILPGALARAWDSVFEPIVPNGP